MYVDPHRVRIDDTRAGAMTGTGYRVSAVPRARSASTCSGRWPPCGAFLELGTDFGCHVSLIGIRVVLILGVSNTYTTQFLYSTYNQ